MYIFIVDPNFYFYVFLYLNSRGFCMLLVSIFLYFRGPPLKPLFSDGGRLLKDVFYFLLYYYYYFRDGSRNSSFLKAMHAKTTIFFRGS